MYRIRVFLPLRIKRLLFRHIVRERDFVRESFIRIPAGKRISVSCRLRFLIDPRRRLRLDRRSATGVKRHRIFQRGFRLRIFGLSVISIYVHVCGQRRVCIRIRRQLIPPCSVIEKPAFECETLFLRCFGQYQNFVPGRFYNAGNVFADIKSDRIFRRNGRFVLNVISVYNDVFSQCPCGKGIFCQFIAPCISVEIPPAERKTVFLRCFGQSDFFIARGFRRADKRFIGVKRNRVFLRILRPAAADGKSPDAQNQTNRCAQNQNNDKVLFFHKYKTSRAVKNQPP